MLYFTREEARSKIGQRVIASSSRGHTPLIEAGTLGRVVAAPVYRRGDSRYGGRLTDEFEVRVRWRERACVFGRMVPIEDCLLPEEYAQFCKEVEG